MKGWDYSSPATYFITICLKPREPYFGEITDGRVHLSGIGNMADHCWKHIPQHNSFAFVDEYIVMPDHMHGIITLHADQPATHFVLRYDHIFVGACHGTPLRRTNKFGPLQSGSLPLVINSYKSAVTRWCYKNGYEGFRWQYSYHEHLIRSEEELNRIRWYIRTNPMQWRRRE